MPGVGQWKTRPTSSSLSCARYARAHAYSTATRTLCREPTNITPTNITQVQDGGIKSFDGTAEKTDDGQGAQASFVTLEETNVVLLIDLGGVRAEQMGDATPPSTVYDSVHSFLLNNSAGYKAHFNSSLFKALSKVAQEREAEEAEKL